MMRLDRPTRARPLSYILLLLVLLGLPTSLRAGGEEQEGYIPRAYGAQLRARMALGNEVRILHVGDSHLSGGFMTRPIEQALRTLYPHCQLERIGVPGATFASILTSKKMERLKTFAPDLIIVSLGTNDSYTTRFLPQVMRTNIEQFLAYVDGELEGEPLIIFTTPPLSYLKKRVRQGTYRTKAGKRRARYTTQYSLNTATQQASDVILSIAQERGYAAYDLTRSMQTKQSPEASASHYLSQRWLHTDRVHYTREGYARLGNYIASWLTSLLAPPLVVPTLPSLPSDSSAISIATYYDSPL